MLHAQKLYPPVKRTLCLELQGAATGHVQQLQAVSHGPANLSALSPAVLPQGNSLPVLHTQGQQASPAYPSMQGTPLMPFPNLEELVTDEDGELDC